MKLFENKSAFSLIEVLLMVTLFAIILSSTISIVGTKTSREDLNAKANQVVGFIKQAHDYSMAGYLEDVWAIKVLDNDVLCEDNGDCMVLYKGRDWTWRDAEYDKFLNFSTGVYIDEVQENDFYFGYLSGWLSMGTSSTSSQSIVLNSNLGETRTIWVDSSGLVFDYYCGDNKCPSEAEACYTCYLDCGICAMGSLDTTSGSNETYAILASGDYGYSADYSEGFTIISKTNPSSLTEISSLNTSYAYALAHSSSYEDFLYVADLTGGLKIIDMSDINNPVVTTTLSTVGTDVAVLIQDDILYVGADSVGCMGYCTTGYIYTYRLTDPANPTYLDSISQSGSISNLLVEGDYAYSPSDATGLTWYDVSDPSDISFVDSVGISTNDYGGIAIGGNHVYVSVDTYGVDIISTSTDQRIGTYNTTGITKDVDANGNYLFVADNSNGLLVLDISDPMNITEKTSYAATDHIDDVYYYDDWIYISDGDNGVRSIHVPQY